MRLWPKREKALTATPAVLEALQDRQWAPWPLLGGGSRQRIVDAFNTAQSANYSWIYANSPAVRTVIDCLVRNAGQLDLRLYEELSESEREAKPDHPAAMSLRYPSLTVTADSFTRQMWKDFLIFDNAYALMLPAAGRQISLFRLPAHMVEIRGASLWQAEGYRVHLRDGTFVDYDPENIMHWCGENPDDPRMGVSRLDTLRSVIAEDAALQAAIVELAQSGLSQPVYAYRPLDAPAMSNKAIDGFEEDLANRMRRVTRKPFALQEGTELRPYGVNPKDAQMYEIRRWAIERVATLYGVPLGMVGLDDNVEDARSQFYADCLPPYCEEYTRFLNLRVCVRVYGDTDLCFEFNLDEKHMGDERLKTLVSATGRPVLLTDEARAMINRPPVDGGDELVTPMNVIVGDNPKPSPQIMGPQNPNGPDQDGSYRENEKAWKDHLGDGKALTALEDIEPMQLHPMYRRDLEAQHRAIDLAQGTVERHFGRVERSMRAKMRKSIKATGEDWERWDREFAADVHETVERIVEAEGQFYALRLGGQFDMARVVNYLKAMAEGAAEGINAAVREEIERTEDFDGTIPRHSQHVESAGSGLGAGAIRWAREEAARQSPGTEQRVKTWIPNTRRHAQYGGQTVPLGENWPAGFAPGSAPGCKCSLSIS